ncbi:unnamed protein product, partial [marine sediment metagenome]
PVFGQSGNYTVNEYFYLPLYGVYGLDEYNAYNAAMQKADYQIESNKTIGDVDTSGTPVANDIPRFTDDNTIEGLSYAELKAALDLEIGTDLQAWDAQLDDISALAYTNSNFIVGDGSNWVAESGATARTSLGIDLSLYYLKTEIDTQGKVETIWGVTLCTDSELSTALADYYLKTAIDTLGEVETIYSKDIIDSDELAALKFTDLDDTPATYTDQAGKYVKVNAGETALEFGTPAGGGTYLELTDTPAAYDNGKYAKSTADGVVWDDPAGAGD